MIHYYIVDAQLATPTAPASAVNTVMRILRNFFQSGSFIFFYFNENEDEDENENCLRALNTKR